MDVPAMIAKYNLKPRGVIQAGSHHGEEIPLWESLGIAHVHFEPVMSNWKKLKELYPKAVAFPCALGQWHGALSLMTTETVNGGQSCSLLTPLKHLEILPWIVFDGHEKVEIVSLDECGLDWSGFNFMYVDVQGYELEVFLGAQKTLAKMDFVFCEVNRAEVFEDCARVEQIDSFLGALGFTRVETEWHGGDFGDALYVR